MNWLKKLIKKIVLEMLENTEITVDPVTRKAEIKIKKDF